MMKYNRFNFKYCLVFVFILASAQNSFGEEFEQKGTHLTFEGSYGNLTYWSGVQNQISAIGNHGGSQGTPLFLSLGLPFVFSNKQTALGPVVSFYLQKASDPSNLAGGQTIN